MSRVVIQQLLTRKEIKMFIITVDFKAALKKKDVPVFLAGIRKSSFGAIPQDVVQRNALDGNADCIAVHLGTGIVGWILRRLKTSGNFPDFLALMLFSAKDAYIPHNPEIISAIAGAAGKYMQSCKLLRPGTIAAAWGMPLVKGKWVAVTAE